MYNIERTCDGMLMLCASVDTPREALYWLSYYIDHYGDRFRFRIVDNAPRFTVDLREFLIDMPVVGHA